MNARPQDCNHCNHPLAPERPFCERCGNPVSQEQTAPGSSHPPSAPPLQGRSPELQPVGLAASQPPRKSPILLIALIAGGLLLGCLLVAGVGVLLWQRGQNREATGPAHVSAGDVVEDFVRATLDTVPGAAVDYDRARSLMTASYAREFDSPEFVAVAYGFQDGPTAYGIGGEELSGPTATVTVLGYWDGELGRRWAFALQEEDGAWKIAAINTLPTPGLEPIEGVGTSSLELLVGEWEIIMWEDGEEAEGEERFRLSLEPDGRLRVRIGDETDLEDTELYLELEQEGPRGWGGYAVVFEWDSETYEMTEWDREPIVVLLSDDEDEMRMELPYGEGSIARRVGPMQSAATPTAPVQSTTTATALVVPAELEEFVARVVASEGAIVAHVITTSVPVAQVSPIKVWRCEHGKLVREDAAALFRALSDDSSEWPPRTRYFAFKSVTSDRAAVDLHTWYDIGMFDEGRGGFAEELEIARRWHGWVVVTRDWYMHWD